MIIVKAKIFRGVPQGLVTTDLDRYLRKVSS